MNISRRRHTTDRAWASYDIVATILETMAPGPLLEPPSIYPYDECAWEDHSRLNRNALARMARVSRALSGLALDVLWRYIDDIFHLVDVVPSCYTIESNWNVRRPYEEIVSSCIVACGSMRWQTLMINNIPMSSRRLLGTPTSGSCVLFGPTLTGYESLIPHAAVSKMTALQHCYVGYLLTSLSCHNCADWTGVSTNNITECH